MIDRNSSICVNCVTLAMCVNKTNMNLVRDCKHISAVVYLNSRDGSLALTNFYGLERRICTERLDDGTVIIRGIGL